MLHSFLGSCSLVMVAAGPGDILNIVAPGELVGKKGSRRKGRGITEDKGVSTITTHAIYA